MQVVYDSHPEQQKESLKRNHPRGAALIAAIELDLSRDPYTRATILRNGRYAQVYTPQVIPHIEIRVAYLVGDKILIKVLNWVNIE